jgi:hypothetical protein
MHLHILCSPTKFCKKNIFFLGLCKKDNFLWYKITIYVTFFCLFYTGHKKCLFTPKLSWMDIVRSDAYSEYFVRFFLKKLNTFKIYFHNRSIWSYEPKHHVLSFKWFNCWFNFWLVPVKWKLYHRLIFVKANLWFVLPNFTFYVFSRFFKGLALYIFSWWKDCFL